MVQITKLHNAVNYTAGRNGNTIDTIVIHHWDDPAKNPSFEGTVRWLSRADVKVSIHYVVEAGRVVEMVDPRDTAWHAGHWPTNLRSIGVEANPRASEADKQTLGNLISYLQNKYGIKRIIGHKDVYGTQCPGRYYPPHQVLSSYIRGGITHSNPPVSTGGSGKDMPTLVSEILAGHWGNGIDRQRRLEAAGYTYSVVQAAVNTALSGGSVPNTANNTVTRLAQEVLAGHWGNGVDRQNRLSKAGHDYTAVQAEVNRLLQRSQTSVSQLQEIARQVIAGHWGNGETRKYRLRNAGYSYTQVQAEVNRQLGIG